MIAFMLLVCILAKSEILTLICISLIGVRFLYRIAAENPHNDL